VTKAYRKMNVWSNSLNNNMDIVLLVILVLLTIILGFLVCLLIIPILNWAGYNMEEVSGGFKTIVALFFTFIAEAVVIFKKIKTPQGELVTNIIESTTKKQYDPITLNTIVSRELTYKEDTACYGGMIPHSSITKSDMQQTNLEPANKKNDLGDVDIEELPEK
jgi:hypothetical protein